MDNHNAATFWHCGLRSGPTYPYLSGFHVKDTEEWFAVAVLPKPTYLGTYEIHVALCDCKDDARRIAGLLNAALWNADPVTFDVEPAEEATVTLAPADLDQFFADNEELRDEEQDIRAALQRGEGWPVGGGAAGAFLILPAEGI